MRLDAFLLADAVSAPGDGKIYIHGGSLSRITAPVLPLTLPQLGFFVRFIVDDDELRRDHDFELSIVDPDGTLVMPPVGMHSQALQELPDIFEGELRYLQLAFNLAGLTFTRAGSYKIQLRRNGQPASTQTLAVIAMTAEQIRALGAPPTSVPANRAARRASERARRRQ